MKTDVLSLFSLKKESLFYSTPLTYGLNPAKSFSRSASVAL